MAKHLGSLPLAVSINVHDLDSEEFRNFLEDLAQETGFVQEMPHVEVYPDYKGKMIDYFHRSLDISDGPAKGMFKRGIIIYQISDHGIPTKTKVETLRGILMPSSEVIGSVIYTQQELKKLMWKNAA